MAINARWFGFNAPFIGGIQNVLSRQVDEKLIKNDILQLISTIPSERVYRNNFGTKLRLVVFESLSDGDLSNLELDIKNAILANDDRVAVNNISCVLSNNGQSVNVNIDLALVNQPLIKYFIEISFNQNGSVTLSK